jgi:predicted NUDIX family phosphoesterase
MSATVEQVLVVPRAVLEAAGLFHGFSPCVEHYLPRVLEPAQLAFLPRPQAEVDPTWKQLIPYVVLRCGDRIFHYTRGASGTEVRLRALRSLGVGGHVCADDGDVVTAYRNGLLRELAEEVDLDTSWTERAIGLINDDDSAVGQVHLGIVHLVELAEPRVRHREAALEACGFDTAATLRQEISTFETWSRFLLEGPWLG